MRPSNLATLAAVGLAVAAPLGVGAQQTTIGMGNKSCTLKPGADCSRVVHKWSAAFHGDAHGAKFTRADLRGADMVGANLSNANLASADLSGTAFLAANLASANVTGATWYRTTCPNGTVTSTACI